jgi:hypothetical protein
VARELVVGDLRVQSLERKDGRWHTIVGPEGLVHQEADGFLGTLEPGTSRTYAYLLVDHLRWLEREHLSLDAVALCDLERYRPPGSFQRKNTALLYPCRSAAMSAPWPETDPARL